MNRLFHLNMHMGRWKSLIDMNWYWQCKYVEQSARRRDSYDIGAKLRKRREGADINKRECQWRKNPELMHTGRIFHKAYCTDEYSGICSIFVWRAEQSIYFTIIEFEHSIYQLAVLFWRPCKRQTPVWWSQVVSLSEVKVAQSFVSLFRWQFVQQEQRLRLWNQTNKQTINILNMCFQSTGFSPKWIQKKTTPDAWAIIKLMSYYRSLKKIRQLYQFGIGRLNYWNWNGKTSRERNINRKENSNDKKKRNNENSIVAENATIRAWNSCFVWDLHVEASACTTLNTLIQTK